MKRKIRNIIIALSLISPSLVYADAQISNGEMVKIELICKKIDTTKNDSGYHRSPIRIPVVFVNEDNYLLFSTPCYESTLQLIIPGTDTPVYTYVIPDGDTEVQLPTSLSGEYELHIHRGNYCFNGIIEL